MIRVYVDIETTGLSPSRDHIVEVGAVAYDDDWREIGRYESMVNPGPDITAYWRGQTLPYNGIPAAELETAQPAAVVSFGFTGFLLGFGAPELYAFNSGFDSGFLAREPWNINPACWAGCVMIDATRLYGDGMRCISLKRAAFLCEVVGEQQHRALADALMAAAVHRHVLSGVVPR
jgi:DNA polymerase III epsilon subunit-like protein